MNEIDDIFNVAAQSEKATFKPEYWDQYAEQFSEENKKRRGIFGFFLGELLFVSCIVLLAYNNSLDNKDDELATNSSLIENEENKEVSSQNSSVNYELVTNSNSNNEFEASQLAINVNDNSPVSNQVSYRQGNESLQEKTNSVSSQSRPSSSNNDFTNKVSKTENKSSSFDNDTFSNNSLISGTKINNSVASTDKSNKDSDLIVMNEDKEKLKNQDSNKGEDLVVEKSQGVTDSNESESSVDEESKAQENQDSTANSVAKPDKKASVITTSKLKKLQFNFQIGGIAYNDFNLNQRLNDIKTGLFAGVEVEYLLHPNLIVSLGVNGYNRNSDGLYIDLDYQDKGFGEVNSKKTYSYNELYFIEVPVNLNYIINSRHKIGAGPTFTRLLTTKVNVVELTKDAESNSNKSNSNNEYLYHYNTFELNNVGININYQYMFNRVGVSLGYTQGLNEFLDKKTFDSNRFNSLNKFNLSVKYKL